MFRLIDKLSSGGVTTACFYKTRTHIGPLFDEYSHHHVSLDFHYLLCEQMRSKKHFLIIVHFTNIPSISSLLFVVSLFVPTQRTQNDHSRYKKYSTRLLQRTYTNMLRHIFQHNQHDAYATTI
jgi:hypothetical protein